MPCIRGLRLTTRRELAGDECGSGLKRPNMARELRNPWFGRDIDAAGIWPNADPPGVRGLLQRGPAHAPTPLREAPGLAAKLGIAQL
jgi:hypothetical protein